MSPIQKINQLLASPGTHYFDIKGEDDTTICIRVSDHSMNKSNNSDRKTLSFISNRTEQRKSGYNQSSNEWVIMANGLTDTFQEISEVLEWNGVIL